MSHMTKNAWDKTYTLPKRKKICRIYNALHAYTSSGYSTMSCMHIPPQGIVLVKRNEIAIKILRKEILSRNLQQRVDKYGIRQWTTMQ